MFRTIRHGGMIAAALTVLAFTPASAATDPADVTFWQSIQSSKNPAEYKAYLSAFPHGAFAGLANERIKELSGTRTGATQTAAAPKPPSLGGVVGKGIITVAPSSPQIGDKITLTFTTFPHVGDYDQVVIVPAGTPDTAINSQATAYTYLNDQNMAPGITFGPFAPGNYEARWLTHLYNNENKYQVGARTQFTVGD